MKAAINEILENKNNIGLDFVVHVRNEKELSDLKDVKNYDCISETIINKYIMKINIIKSYQLLSRKEFISKIKQCLSKPAYDIYYRNNRYSIK